MKRARTYSNGSKRPFKRGKVTYAPSSSLQVVRKELKGLDTDIDIASGSLLNTTNTNGASVVLNLIQAGTGSWNRIGRKVTMKSLRLKGTARYEYASAATTGDLIGATMRMVVVYDRQPSSGSIPTFDTIFGRTAQDGTESCEFLDNLRFDNTGRFRVVCDKVISATPQTENSSGGTSDNVLMLFDFDHYVKLGQEAIYSGQSSPMTIADISSGALYIYYRASANSATSQWYINNASARLRYMD